MKKNLKRYRERERSIEGKRYTARLRDPEKEFIRDGKRYILTKHKKKEKYGDEKECIKNCSVSLSVLFS